jgi:hypothetical protein
VNNGKTTHSLFKSGTRFLAGFQVEVAAKGTFFLVTKEWIKELFPTLVSPMT